MIKILKNKVEATLKKEKNNDKKQHYWLKKEHVNNIIQTNNTK